MIAAPPPTKSKSVDENSDLEEEDQDLDPYAASSEAAEASGAIMKGDIAASGSGLKDAQGSGSARESKIIVKMHKGKHKHRNQWCQNLVAKAQEMGFHSTLRIY